MATINQLRQERLAFFREIKRATRPVDSAVEQMQRYVQRILDRRRDVPEETEFQELARLLQQIVELLVLLEKVLEAGGAVFNVPVR